MNSINVCLWTTLLKKFQQIGMEFYGGVVGGIMKNWLTFGCEPKNTHTP